MAQTAADFMLDRLSGWGVKRIDGYPGDGISRAGVGRGVRGLPAVRHRRPHRPQRAAVAASYQG